MECCLALNRIEFRGSILSIHRYVICLISANPQDKTEYIWKISVDIAQPIKPIRVTFFGDSICVGQGVSIHAGWVARIGRQLDRIARKYDREILVTNASVNGSTTRQALERMPYEIQSQNVDVLIIQFGLNDCNYWLTDRGMPRVSPTAFEANLKEIILRGKNFGSKYIFLNSNHPTIRDFEFLPETSITYEQSSRPI